jgi:hypothetical protein
VSLQLKVFWTGLAIYIVSFFLLATGGSSSPGDARLPGFFCALYALVLPWYHNPLGHQGIFEGEYLEYFSLLIGGWINPIFLITAFFDLTDLHPRAAAIMRILVIVMIPFCWVFFYYGRDLYHPREGHFVWVFGMLMTLFSRELAGSGNQKSTA